MFLKVKEIAGQKRNPSQDKSTYNLCWSAATKQPLEDNSVKIGGSFLLISLENEELDITATTALRNLGVRSDDIWSIMIQDLNCNIQEKLQPLFAEIYNQGKEMIILNMLPMSTVALPLELGFTAKAEWLCFESTLEMMKILSKLNMSNTKIIAICCNNGEELNSASNKINGWKGISRGMVVSADLEVRQRVISAELRCNADESAFIKLILACAKETVEDRITITDKQVLQPIIQRYNFKVSCVLSNAIR